MALAVLLLAVLTVAVARPSANSAASGPLFDPATGYRISQLRDPVPHEISGGTVLCIDKLEAMLASSRPLLIDVLDDRPGRLNHWTLGIFGKPQPRSHIAGSIALPGLGQASVTAGEDARLRLRLRQATKGDRTQPLVFYCLANCWTSWNAARRAISYGYLNVSWFRDGFEGWSDAGLPVTPVEY
jgi:PQQ-dependent catabolism-associated CXXCW motif protein